MLSPTFASPVNIQHVPTFARFRGQHVVNICSSRPPSDGLAQRTLKIKLERLKNRSKPPKSRSKSLDSSKKRPQTGLTGNIFNICKATGRVNIQHCCQHLQQMASTFNINSCGDLVNVFPHSYLARMGSQEGPCTFSGERRCLSLGPANLVVSCHQCGTSAASRHRQL